MQAQQGIIFAETPELAGPPPPPETIELTWLVDKNKSLRDYMKQHAKKLLFALDWAAWQWKEKHPELTKERGPWISVGGNVENYRRLPGGVWQIGSGSDRPMGSGTVLYWKFSTYDAMCSLETISRPTLISYDKRQDEFLLFLFAKIVNAHLALAPYEPSLIWMMAGEEKVNGEASDHTYRGGPPPSPMDPVKRFLKDNMKLWGHVPGGHGPYDIQCLCLERGKLLPEIWNGGSSKATIGDGIPKLPEEGLGPQQRQRAPQNKAGGGGVGVIRGER